MNRGCFKTFDRGQGVFEIAPKPHAMGLHHRPIAAHIHLNQISFYDVTFNNLIDEPIGTVKRIYEYFGRKVSFGHERRMRVWIRDNPPGKRGRHHYSLEDFGIDSAKVNKRFDGYRERFGIQFEN